MHEKSVMVCFAKFWFVFFELDQIFHSFAGAGSSKTILNELIVLAKLKSFSRGHEQKWLEVWELDKILSFWYKETSNLCRQLVAFMMSFGRFFVVGWWPILGFLWKIWSRYWFSVFGEGLLHSFIIHSQTL